MPVALEIDDRADRLLDAAAELLVSRGYRRVTIEDVAQHAGIGKGTVYLHFRTKDALFLTVMLRIHRRLYAELAALTESDPSLVLPWRTVRFVHERIAVDDIARPLYLGDPEVLGRLATESATTMAELGRRGAEVGHQQFTLLRAAGQIRTDLAIDEQIHCFGAVATGFFMAGDGDGGSPGRIGTRSAARRAELLEHTVAALLREPGARPDAPALVDAAPVIAAQYRSLIEHLDSEWERRTR